MADQSGHGPADTLTINTAVVQSILAMTMALLDVVRAVADRAVVSEIDGEPIGVFTDRRAREHLEALMRRA